MKLLRIMLVAFCLPVLVSASADADHRVTINKTHQSFFKIVDRQDFYIRDSAFVQESRTMVSHDLQMLDMVHLRRIVRFDEGMVYQLNLRDATVASLPLDEFMEVHAEQRQQACKDSQERADVERKLLESRRRTPGGKKLRDHGPWAERFEWFTDTLASGRPVETALGPGWEQEVRIIGVVREEPLDTLSARRHIRLVDSNPSLVALGESMSRLTDGREPAEWLRWFFTKYHFHGNAGFAEGVQYLVPPGGGFDTCYTDIAPPDSGLPVASCYRIRMNDRERHGLIAKGNAVEFANQTYIVKTLVDKNVLLADSMAVTVAGEEPAPDSLFAIPENFESTFFTKEEVLRFFETESWIVTKEFLRLAM